MGKFIAFPPGFFHLVLSEYANQSLHFSNLNFCNITLLYREAKLKVNIVWRSAYHAWSGICWGFQLPREKPFSWGRGQWQIQGRGPGRLAPSPLFLDQKEARRAPKKFFWGRPHPPHLRVWVTRPPPPFIWRSGSATEECQGPSERIPHPSPTKCQRDLPCRATYTSGIQTECKAAKYRAKGLFIWGP